MPEVYHNNGRTQHVSLGLLVRKLSKELPVHVVVDTTQGDCDAKLYVRFEEFFYACGFADRTVLLDWINGRRNLRGVFLVWNGVNVGHIPVRHIEGMNWR